MIIIYLCFYARAVVNSSSQWRRLLHAPRSRWLTRHPCRRDELALIAFAECRVEIHPSNNTNIVLSDVTKIESLLGFTRAHFRTK